MNIDRTDLYRLVWALPAVRIAELLGVSGNAVLKACKRRSVPVPGRGYWTRVQHGQPRTRVSLPEAGSKYPPIVVSEPRAAAVRETLASLPELPEQCEAKGVALGAAEDELGGPMPELTTSGVEVALPAESLAGVLAGGDACAGSPTTALLLSLARQLENHRLIGKLVAEVERRHHECEASVSAVLALWLIEAKAELETLDPVSQILGACRTVLENRSGHRWWELPRQK